MTTTLLFPGPSALALVVPLAVLEASLSFDNAVVNATILERLPDLGSGFNDANIRRVHVASLTAAGHALH